MKLAALPIALLLASGSVQAHSDKDGAHISCDIGSQYSLRTYRSAFLFSQKDGQPAEIGLGGGRLFIDGHEATLTAADHQRLGEFESQMHALVPVVQQVTLEAVDIAFSALIEVARGLASDPQAAIASLEASQKRVRREMSAKPLAVFNDDAMEGIVKPLVSEFVPEIVGGAVSSALKAAFSGEKEAQAFEARMNRMEHELDTRVEARAKALEPLADNMCSRLRRMDELDNALEFRLPDGEPLQLLRVERHED